MRKIGIIDVGVGNVGSLERALERAGVEHERIRKSTDVPNFGHLILPGVGHFDGMMNELMEHSFDLAIKDFVKTGKYLLGICAGMQVLGENSEEGRMPGLNLIKGICVKIKPNNITCKNKIVGWHKTTISEDIELTNFVPKKGYYFVHGYEFKNNDKSAQIESILNSKVVATIQKNNILGVQFHPEKSNIDGQKILKRFANYD
jgi:glutamine amidotransferase